MVKILEIKSSGRAGTFSAQLGTTIASLLRRPRTLAVYLAGPGVFRPNANAIGSDLKALCARYGFAGIWPGDENRTTFHSQMVFISNRNAIRSSVAVIADISPFRGPHMDCGTAFEIGLAYQAGIPVFAYTSSAFPNGPGAATRRPSTLAERVWAGFEVNKEDGEWRDKKGNAVENFDRPENLMIVHALQDWAVSVCAEDAIRRCAEHFGHAVNEPGAVVKGGANE